MGAKIMIADDHPLFRDALKQAISTKVSGYDILHAHDIDSLQLALRETPQIELILLDLTMPGSDGLSGFIAIKMEHPAIPVIVISAIEDVSTIRKCLDMGASGFITKSSDIELITKGIKAVIEGEIWVSPHIDIDADMNDEDTELLGKLHTLTPQQYRVLTKLAEGLLNKQIAYELGVTEATVKAHVSAILLKLEVHTRTQAILLLNKLNLEAPEPD